MIPSVIHLIGPGGAGKSTTGKSLAEALGDRFFDLDQEYLQSSSIDDDIKQCGYEYYVAKNVDVYLGLRSVSGDTVMATSSGFMTYGLAIHEEIARIHNGVLRCPNTVLLMPSFDREICIQKTIRRQLLKPHEDKSEGAQGSRMTSRYPIYVQMGHIKIATDVPTAEVVDLIVAQLSL